MAFFSLDPDHPGLLDPDGRPFFTLGVNYEGYFDRAWAMWRPGLFDLTLIERDFAKARACGFNTVRLFVQKENRNEVERGNWRRFDAVIHLARKYGLAVMLTFNDEHRPHLEAVGRFNARIAAHFKGDPIIHSWDLENEPRLYNLLVAVYPDAPCPLLTSALVDHYGQFVPRTEVDMKRVPGSLRKDRTRAFYYANAVEAYIRFARDARASGLPTIVDYMRSDQSEYWKPFLRLLNDTLAAWLKPQIEPLRAADPNRLLSVGWNWESLAALPANRALDFHMIHKYGTIGYKPLNNIFSILKALQRTFPSQPVLMGEFGYSTGGHPYAPKEAHPVDPRLVALHEAATLCFLRAEGFAGGLKWMLNDVRTSDNPFEAGLGIYADGDREKPSRRVYSHLAALWRQTEDRGHLKLEADDQTLIRLHYQCESGGLSGGGRGSGALAWNGGQPVHIFTTCSLNGQIRVEADAPLSLRLDPQALSARWQPGRGTAIYRLWSNTFSAEETHPPGQPVPLSLTDGLPRLLSPCIK